MNYKETLPDDIFSHHIESYWELVAFQNGRSEPLDILLPTCTFNIIIIDQACQIKTHASLDWTQLSPGAFFFGQRNSCIRIKSEFPLTLSGVRFKPFAFANIISTPLYHLNDTFTQLENIKSINTSTKILIDSIIENTNDHLKFQLINELMYSLFKASLSIDEKLRAQLNYIMDRKGVLKVRELFDEFNVSKATLRNHFRKKVGLTPKKVAQIWRMNYLLQMKEENPGENLTSLAIEAGFFDQAHFIKDFKQLFDAPPRKFFIQNESLLKVAHLNISNRFTNKYDPR